MVGSGGSLRNAVLGDISAGVIVANGWAGIVINGAVCDVERLRTFDIGIKALGVTLLCGAKEGIGAWDVPVAFGGMLFVPGYCV